MKTIAIAIAAFGLTASSFAGSAFAAQSATDVDFMRASRCKGIAEGLGQPAANIDAFLKAEGRTRLPMVQDKAQDYRVRAKREVSRADSKDKFAAELAGACAAFSGETKALAAR